MDELKAPGGFVSGKFRCMLEHPYPSIRITPAGRFSPLIIDNVPEIAITSSEIRAAIRKAINNEHGENKQTSP